jgi:peptidoglycan/xylan/chitin deacetylase (PgdA/CDA1 family)
MEIKHNYLAKKGDGVEKIKVFLSKILNRLGIFAIIRWFNRNRLTIIFYHYPEPGVLDMHFNYLSKIFNFISIDDFVKSCNEEGRSLPPYSLLVTIDDGWKNNIDLLPVFTKYKVKPLIYLCSQVVNTYHPFWTKMVRKENIEYYKSMPNAIRVKALKDAGLYTPDMNCPEPQGLSLEDIMALKGNVSFGAHTRYHPVLKQCTDEEQEEEIIDSKKELENICGESILHFAAPFGDYNDYTLKCIKKAGYITARTVKKGWNRFHDDKFQLKSFAISDDADIDILRIQISGITGLKNIFFRTVYFTS